MSSGMASNTGRYLVKMPPDRLQALHESAREAGIPLAEAFREGAERYLADLNDQPVTTFDALSNDLRALARRVDRDLKGST